MSSSFIPLYSCLKLYCQCFALSSTCGPKCKCQSCNNTPLHAKAIRDSRATILERNPGAFDDKFRGVHSQVPVYAAMPHQETYYTTSHPAEGAASTVATAPPASFAPTATPPPHQRVNKFGCKCRRSLCLKKVRELVSYFLIFQFVLA